MGANSRFWKWFYDAVAPLYDLTLDLGSRLGVSSEARVRREVISKLQIKERGLVLEIGCGTGSNRPFLFSDVNYIGVDLSRGMLLRARSKCQRLSLPAFWVQANAQALPFRSACGDATISMGIWQHLAQPERALSEISRVSESISPILLIDERRSLRPIARILTAKAGVNEDENSTKIVDWVIQNLRMENIEWKVIGEYFILQFSKKASITKMKGV